MLKYKSLLVLLFVFGLIIGAGLQALETNHNPSFWTITSAITIVLLVLILTVTLLDDKQ